MSYHDISRQRIATNRDMDGDKLATRLAPEDA